MSRHIELNPANHLTVGTIGEPGARTFYLQGGSGSDIISLVMEKVQASALADSFEDLLEELLRQHPNLQNSLDESIAMDLRLRLPIETSLFRIGNLGLGYNEDIERAIVVAYELVDEEAGEEPNVVSFWVKPQVIQALIEHTRYIVSSGRPICGNCGQPINAGGHFCPHRNGFKI